MIKRISALNLAAYLIHAGMALFTQMKWINHTDVGEISALYPSLFTPAGFTFSIWSVIYTALLGFCTYHLVMALKKNASHPANLDIKKTATPFIVNNLAAALWLVVWVNNLIAISTILIIVQLISLVMIHERLNIHSSSRSLASKTFTQFPLSIYFGWITIATISNIAVWLVCMDWSGWGVSPINWTITLIAIAVFMTVNVINRRRNVFFGLVVIWALYGIAENRAQADFESYQPIIWICRAGMGIIAIACIFGLVRNLRRR